jgi:hypothetical protein
MTSHQRIRTTLRTVFINRIFYFLKPVIPRRIQIILRRVIVKRKLRRYSSVWPILDAAAKKPEDWIGWPEGKEFAFVLTHDVESRTGHDKCTQLMMMEKKMGFVSSFNFVPERYNVDKELRDLIVSEGFEVGVHGLNHDGKLFQSKKIFSERVPKINYYLKEWNAVGFRAPAMHHNLEWINDLNIEYDLSTFDTDPFEPQSDGVKTIFPFIYKGNNKSGSSYLELPYTLVQDFTLFILMQEKDCSIWKLKLDWIVKNKGMALLNVHPDYIDFSDNRSLEKFPIKLYKDFLNHVKNNYAGKFWNALPREVAAYVKNVSH